MFMKWIAAIRRDVGEHFKVTKHTKGLPKTRNPESGIRNPESGIRKNNNKKTKMKICRYENFNEG